MVPVWGAALNKTKKLVGRRQIPLLALYAAFSFVIMMFNIPVVGGSSAHAVGAVFAAIALGPWPACVSISIALLIQALVFGDGGILSYGLNCINIAVIMPFTGYAVYRLIAGKNTSFSKRSAAGAFIGSYIGINAAAFAAAVEFGIQPLIFKTASGAPLYCPYPLSVSIPAMMFTHTLFAGPLEAVITATALALVSKYAPDMLCKNISAGIEHNINENKSSRRKIIAAFAVLVLLTPLGLFASGTAWGEWGLDELKADLGFIPQGMAKLSDLWHGLLPDYSFEGAPEKLVYSISALIGTALIFTVILVTSKIIMHIKKADKS
ncbi:MAG: cobalt transporter CbiM, partial [[Clostridium] cellulosi]